MFGQGFNYGFLGKPPCFTDTTDIFKDNSGVALYTLDYDASDAGGVSGKFNQGATFVGNSAGIVNTTLQLSSTAHSVSLWMKPQDLTASKWQIMFFSAFNGYPSFTLGKRPDRTTSFHYRNESSNEVYFTLSNANTWYHVVVTRNNSGSTVYVNGSSVATDSNSMGTYSSSSYQKASIGSNPNYPAEYFDGTLDQVRVYDVALTATDVANLYNNETTATTGTLSFPTGKTAIATYTLENSGTDISGNHSGVEGTNVIYKYDGTPTAVDFGVGGKTLYGARFNGSSSYITSNSLPSIGTGDFTFSCWFNQNSGSSQGALFSTTTQWFAANGYESPKVLMVTDDTVTKKGDTAYSQDTWNHAVFARESGVLKIYQNGTEVFSGAYTDSWDMTQFGIGVARAFGSRVYYFNGSIDQVRVFNKALSSAEVSKLYGNGAGEIACEYTATTTDIDYPVTNLAYYKLDNDSKDSAKSSGKFNQGAIFNGISSAITLPSIPGLPTNSNNTNNFTFSCWVRSTTTRLNNGGGSNPIFVNYVGSYQFIGFGGNDNGNFPTGKLFYYTYGGTGQHNSWIITPNTYDDGQWHHLAVTDKYNSAGDNRTRTLYVDGTQIAQDTVDKNFFNSGATNLLIGDATGSGNRHLDADLDQIRIYDTALDSTDVSNLYAETVSDTSTLSFPSGQTAIATYKLDGNSTDLSGNYNGTDTNITYAYDGTESNIEYRFGKYGQAAVFNGSSSFIDTGSVFSDDVSQITYSAWVNFYNLNTQNFIMFPDSGTTGHGFGFFDYGNGNLYFQSDNTTNSNRGYISNSGLYSINEWVHFALVFDGTATGNSNRLKAYVNGNLLNLTFSGTIPTTTKSSSYNLLIGSRKGGNSLNGKIDQVRIFSSALTSTQVESLYNEKPEVDTSNFKTVLYEGNGSAQYVSNVGFQPDLLFLKARNQSYNWSVYDSVRGANKLLQSNTTIAEFNGTNAMNSFDANGFTLGAGENSNDTSGGAVSSVGFCWKAGGLLNKSASFNGSSSKIVLPTSTFSPSTFTLSAWCNVTSDTAENTILELFDNQTYPNHTTIVFAAGSSGYSSRFLFRNYTTNQYNYNPSGTVQKNVWKHYVMTYDGSTVKSYIDGSLVDSGNLTLSNTVGTITSIQLGLSSGTRYLNGNIDQVRIFNKAISSSEVTSLYNETASTINTLQVLGDTSCIAAYPLGTGAGDIGNTYSGTPTNVTFNNPGHLTRNNSGTIESMVSANTAAGFSIVKYTGNLTAGATIGHGLSSAPELIIGKRLVNSGGNWTVFAEPVGATAALQLNTTIAAATATAYFNDTAPTDSVFTLGSNSNLNNTEETIAYCFHSVAGYSKIGSYNGSTTTVTVTTGFKPSFVMLKRTNSNKDWSIFDTRRSGGDQMNDYIVPNTSASEYANSTIEINAISTGFTIASGLWSGMNENGGEYIYMAFK